MRPATMIICALSLLCLHFAGCETGAEKPVRWSAFHSEEHGFGISIPEGYGVHRGTSNHAFGTHSEFALYWRKPATGLAHLGLKLVAAGYYEVPGLRGRYGTAYILDSFVRAEMRRGGSSTRGRILQYSADSLAGYPARAFRSLTDNGKADSLYLCEQFVLAGNRMYHLRTNGYLPNPDTPAMRVFLQSFRLLRT